MNVTLFQDGLEVASAVTHLDGKFEIVGLQSGIYALVAYANSGGGGVGIEARQQMMDK
jgi:hypothetical protein